MPTSFSLTTPSSDAAKSLKDLAQDAGYATKWIAAFQRAMSHTTSELLALGKTTSQIAKLQSEAESSRSAVKSAGGSSSGSGDKSGGDGAASQLSNLGAIGSTIGPRIQSALANVVTPLRGNVELLESQFNRLAGTLTEQARRIDATMKMPGFIAFTKQAETGLAQVALNLANVREMAARLSPAIRLGFSAFVTGANLASGTVREIRIIAQTLSFLSSVGDVARKPLDAIKRITFDGPVRSAKALAGAFPGISSAATSARSSIVGFGRDLLVALGAFGLAYKAVSFFKSGITGAIDLNETISATKVTFKDASGEVSNFADELATKFGKVKNETLNIANGFGDFGQASGMAAQESAAFSIKMTKLAADLGSFKHIPFADAAAKIQSGLAGQSEPLRKYGVLLSEDAVKAKAMAMGLASSNTELTEGAKVSARAALIQEGLAKANGDLARTADQPANTMAKLTGNMANFAAAIGTLVMPATASFLGVMNDLLASIIGVFEGSKPTLLSWVGTATAGIGQVGVVVRNFSDFWLIAKLRFREFTANFVAGLQTLPANAAIVASYIGRNWLLLIGDGIDASITAFRNFGTYVQALASSVFAWLQNPMSEFKAPDWKPLLDGFRATAEKLPEMIKPAWVSLQDEIDTIGNRIAAKEAARTKKMAEAAKDAAADTAAATATEADKTNKATENKFAGAAEQGSKEAYSAILKGRPDSSDPMKDVAKNGKEAVGVQRQILDAVKAKPNNAGVPVFQM